MRQWRTAKRQDTIFFSERRTVALLGYGRTGRGRKDAAYAPVYRDRTPIGLMAEKPWQQFQPARGTTRKCECSPSPRAADAREAILGRQILGQGFLLALSTTRRIQRLRRIVTALEPSIERARAALER
jgi:hypothetical protein